MGSSPKSNDIQDYNADSTNLWASFAVIPTATRMKCVSLRDDETPHRTLMSPDSGAFLSSFLFNAHTTGLPSSVCLVDCAINGFLGDQISLLRDYTLC